MFALLVLGGYAALTGAVLPYALRRARWAHRGPRLAVFAWHGLMVSFVVSLALTAHGMVSTERHIHSGWLGLLNACGIGPAARLHASAPSTADLVAFLVPVAVAALPVGWFAVALWRAFRSRRHHARRLDLVSRPLPRYRAVVLDHPVPAAYCLPGRGARVVLTRGALEALSPEQLNAVLEHERAHISGRHHLAIAAAEAFSRAFPGLPLARHAREQTALLLEMAADDRALRNHPPEVLATAMVEVASGAVPQAALGAGGGSAVTRVRRLLSPAAAEPRPIASLAIMAGVVAAPLMPLLFACGAPFTTM